MKTLTFDYDNELDKYIVYLNGEEYIRTSDMNVAVNLVKGFYNGKGTLSPLYLFKDVSEEETNTLLRGLGARVSDVPR